MDTNPTDTRKSLMLDPSIYAKISTLAKKAGVPRPVVVEGMLGMVDEVRLLAKLQEIRATAKAEAAEERKKRQALASLASELDMGQIEALLAQLNKS